MTRDSHSDVRVAADRQALLELMLAEQGLEAPVVAAIPRRDPGQAPVLSYAQERMWFLEQFETDTTALSIRSSIRLRGQLDVEVLRRSFDAIVARHESLRTVIANVAGEPRPSVIAAASAPFAMDDLGDDLGSGLGAGAPVDRDERLAAILAEESARTFDLEHDLPILVRLIRLADDDHVLSVVLHHIASDGWSLRVFFGELGVLYGALLEGRDPQLPALPIQYHDYAAWQRGAVSGEALDRQLRYWTDQLGGGLPMFELPPDFSRPPRHTFEGGQFERRLSPEVTEGLRELSRRCGATLFMTMLAAFELVVARRAGQDEVVVGTPVAGRVRPELEPMIGMFLNTLVLRTDLTGDPTFTELIGRVRDVSLGAFDNQDVPFEQLLAELHPARDLSRTPLFQVFFNMTNSAVDTQIEGLSGLRAEVIVQPDLGSKFDLTLYVDDHDRRADLLLVYNRNLYLPDTMSQLLEQYLFVLEAVVTDPSRPISEYSLVTPEAMVSLPDQALALDATWRGSVPGAVLRQAGRVPDRIAVVDGSDSWSYAVLAANMSRLAHWLRLRGIGAGDIVAIYGHRSASLVWAVTGALASGAAYVLLDPQYPPARLAEYLRVASPKAWLALSEAGLPSDEVIEQLDRSGVSTRLTVPPLSAINGVDELAGIDATTALSEVIDDTGPDDLACLTFTSGSTGVPKAVMGRHGSLTHFLPWMSDRFDITEHDRFSMLSGLAHDPIQRDIFTPLGLGATLVVPDPESIGSPGWLARWLRDEGITVAHLTPAMGQLLAEGTANISATADPVRIPALRRAFFVGDVLTRRDVARLQHIALNLQVVNLYGTTETQRAVAYHVVDPVAASDSSWPRAREILPLGVGMPGVQLLVRDDSGAPAGFGEVGEVWFRSHHLAIGYLDQPDESAEKFLPNGLTNRPGDRLYRTGDRGRYRSDGSVEFFGRLDGQVQVRGFRIELGEVQGVLGRHPQVRDAVVQLRTDENGLAQLIGYVVPTDLPGPEPSDLARFMRNQLPAHMSPARFVVIERIPLTPNGKIDRDALPSAMTDRGRGTGGEPRDRLERMLVGIWEDVLDSKGVGIHDNFFDLGGYSLLATRLFAIIEERTGERLPISTLFETPTIAELAGSIRHGGRPTAWSSLVPIQPRGEKPPFFYVAPYLISVLQFAHLGEELGQDQPLYGLQPQGLDGQLPAHDRIENMAAHYIDELKTVQPRGPYALGGHCSGAWVAFEMARQLEARGDELRAVVLVDQGPPGVERPEIRKWAYLVNRLRFYFSDGRLLYSLKWQLKITTARYVLRRVGPPTARFTEEVRSKHRKAFADYRGGKIKHDLVLVRSAESLALDDKVWYLRWVDKTDGELTVDRVSGTHANLLEQPYVVELADVLRKAFDHADARRE